MLMVNWVHSVLVHTSGPLRFLAPVKVIIAQHSLYHMTAIASLDHIFSCDSATSDQDICVRMRGYVCERRRVTAAHRLFDTIQYLTSIYPTHL